jgi:hypothetical protein
MSLNRGANQELLDYYRISAGLIACATAPSDPGNEASGFFRFAGQICYGKCVFGTARNVEADAEFDASKHAVRGGATVRLPFSFTEVIDNLRFERYRQSMTPLKESLAQSDLVASIYRLIRSGLPLKLRRQLQRAYFRNWRKFSFPAWPVDFTVDLLHKELLRLLMHASGVKKVPFIWFWPDGASSCLMMTHDVETAEGRDFTPVLMDLDEAYSIPASFQVIPEERYNVPAEYLANIRRRGFELNVHDLNHDGALYRGRSQFSRRAAKINRYLRTYAARGFRAGSMYRNQDWYEDFEFSYDMSVPNVAHLEPMCGGCCTVMPYFIGGILELPLTMAQDYSLFHILDDYSTDVWMRQMSLIREQNGLMSFVVHPDYLVEPRARQVYVRLLDCLREATAQREIWAALPGDVELWWRARSRMSLVERDGRWAITGPGSERARLAYATLDGDRLMYALDEVGSRATTVQ